MSKDNKDYSAEKFKEEYISLNDTKQNLFSRLCNKLISDNFIYGQIESDHSDYYDILNYKETIEAYLNIIDYDLIHDDSYKIFYLNSRLDKNRVRFNKMETIFLLILRLLYEIKIRSVSLDSNISITFDELMNELSKTMIYNNQINKMQCLDVLKKFKRFKLIDCDLKNIDAHDVIRIYPTLLYIVKLENIEEISLKIKSYAKIKEKEVDDDEVSEN